MTQGEKQSQISIIVPVLNEAKIIQETLSKAQQATNVEIIVVDGGSQDDTVEVAQSLGIKAIAAPAGRAHQMNAGARIATGEMLLFLHADTHLPEKFEQIVRQELSRPGVVAGAFELGIDGTGWGLRLVEKGVSWRSRFLALPYGDQAIFLQAPIFWQVGGFREIPIMEDFELMRRLSRIGKVAIAPASVKTSARRWQQHGVFKTTLINQLVILGYFLRVPPDHLVSWYRRQKSSKI